MRKILVSGYRSAAAFAAVGLLLVAGCSSDSEQPSGAEPQDIEESSAEGTVEDLADISVKELEVAVGRAKLNEGDIGDDMSVEDTSEGLDAPTNDICGQNWATNNLRIARQQDYFWNSDEQPAELVVSNEVVAYEKDKATDVLNEIDQSVEDCGGWEHAEGEMGDVELVEPPAGSTGESTAWQAVDSREEGSYTYVAVYQTKGDLLSALYIWSTDEDEAQQVAEQLTPLVADKLEGVQN